jgi:hypothetical protein
MSMKKRAKKEVVARAQAFCEAWEESTLGDTWDEAQALVDALNELEEVVRLKKKFGRGKDE